VLKKIKEIDLEYLLMSEVKSYLENVFDDCEVPMPHVMTKSGKKGFHFIYFLPNPVPASVVDVFFRKFETVFKKVGKQSLQEFFKLLQFSSKVDFSKMQQLVQELPGLSQINSFNDVVNFLKLDPKTLAGGAAFRLYVPQVDEQTGFVRKYEEIFVARDLEEEDVKTLKEFLEKQEKELYEVRDVRQLKKKRQEEKERRRKRAKNNN